MEVHDSQITMVFGRNFETFVFQLMQAYFSGLAPLLKVTEMIEPGVKPAEKGVGEIP